MTMRIVPVLVLLLSLLSRTLVGANPAQAQEPGDVGASAIKNCPGETALIGSTITCTFLVANVAGFPGLVTTLTETSPEPGGTPVPISCQVAGGTTIGAGDTLGANTLCFGSFQATIPNDPALCGTSLRDRVDIALQYQQFNPPLTAGAFATHTTVITCPTPTPTPPPVDTPTTTPVDTPTPGEDTEPTPTPPPLPSPVLFPSPTPPAGGPVPVETPPVAAPPSRLPGTGAGPNSPDSPGVWWLLAGVVAAVLGRIIRDRSTDA